MKAHHVTTHTNSHACSDPPTHRHAQTYTHADTHGKIAFPSSAATLSKPQVHTVLRGPSIITRGGSPTDDRASEKRKTTSPTTIAL